MSGGYPRKGLIMPRKKGPTDAYMNFKAVEGGTGADSDALQEYEETTGLSVRGQLVWLIHKIEWFFDVYFTTNFLSVNAALSTVSGLSAMPEITDIGCVARVRCGFNMVTSGASRYNEPFTQSFLPPIPLAAPKLNLYVQGAADHADGQNKDVNCRIGFTTTALDSAMYTEIAETWGW